MAAANRSPLGFLPILLFHLCILAAMVLLQNLHDGNASLFYGAVGAGAVVAGMLAWQQRRFLWDVFRGFKSAGVLLTLLVLSCQLGTMIIQDLDLRRADVYDKGITPDGSPPPFDSRNMATRFALAESHAILWASPGEERTRMYEEKVRLSPTEEAQRDLRARAFGERAGNAFEEGVLASKRRGVDQLTTSNYAQEHRAGFYKAYLFLRGMHFFDIFESWWFYALLALIAINVTVGTIARAPWNWRDFGLAVTHAGILIILTGALVDLCVAKEGYIWFTYGKPELQVSDKLEDKKNLVYWNLPFRVHLDRFATEYYHELLVRRIDSTRRHDGTPWQEPARGGTPFSTADAFPIRVGVPWEFEGGRVQVIVHEYKPRVFIETTVEDVPGGPEDPALRLGIYHEPTGGENLLVSANLRSWLFALDPSRRVLDIPVEGGEVRIEYVHARNATEYAALTERSPMPDNGTLVIRLKDEQQRLPVTLGGAQRIALGGRTMKVEFLSIQSALADSQNVNLDRNKQRSEEPVLFLRIDGRDIFVPRDDKEFAQDFDFLADLEMRFDWPDPRDHGVFDIYRIVDMVGRPPVLMQRDEGEGPALSPVGAGQTAALVGRLRGYYLGVERTVASGKEQPGVVEVSDEQFLKEGGGARDNLLAAWADVEVTGDWGTVRREITPFHPAIEYGKDAAGNPLYTFNLVQTEQARDWFSVLSVLDNEGNRIKTHAVQVNKPLRYDGYRFFQANAGTGKDGLGISGISVTKNPGVYYMYVGYIVLVLGVCLIFFYRPIYDRRRRAQRATKEQAA